MKNKPLRLDEHGIESLIVRSQKWLYNYVPQRVWYPKALYRSGLTESETIELFKEASESPRNDFLDTEVHNSKNLYAIWTEKTRYSKKWELKYIGQRHSSGIKDRLKNHLFGSPFGTGKKPKSKFNDVYNLLSKNQLIYVSYVQVSPESLRSFIEHSLICVNTEKKENLWNSHGAKNVARDLEDLSNSSINIARILKT